MIEQPEFILQPGLIVNQEFFDYPAMQESAKNWLFTIKYRLGKGDFYGCHDGIQLNNLQFGHAHRNEGMFFNGISPKDCLTILILQKSEGYVCLNNLKMKEGNILIIDDSKPYDFSSNKHTSLAVISIDKTLATKKFPWLLLATDKIFKDWDNILSKRIEDEWISVLKKPKQFENPNKLQDVENRIIDSINDSTKGQRGENPHLTQGEETALKVRTYLLESLEETVTIQSIAKDFEISDKTLESSFKSLFGITPKHFLVLLKLNHAHEDLLLLESGTKSISDIAMKWGFANFGRFSKNYKALFGNLPSETLSSTRTRL